MVACSGAFRCIKLTRGDPPVAAAYYVYYRLRPGSAHDAQGRVSELHDRLHTRCGVRGRLLIKRDEPDLWMEVYEQIEDAATFEAALAEESAQLGLGQLLSPGSQRNLECFVDPAECA